MARRKTSKSKVISAGFGGPSVTTAQIRRGTIGGPPKNVVQDAEQIVQARPRFVPTSAKERRIASEQLAKRGAFPTKAAARVALQAVEFRREEIFLQRTGLDPTLAENRAQTRSAVRERAQSRQAEIARRRQERLGQIPVTPALEREVSRGTTVRAKRLRRSPEFAARRAETRARRRRKR